MHITEVQLENIKSHVNSTFKFGRGTTAITGENGAGKTTILEAVAWALFDVLEYKLGDFVRRGAKKGSVRVTFSSDLDQREYMVYRDTAGGYYVYDSGINTKLAEKKTDVAAVLRQRLGVEPGTDLEDLFRHAIGVPQGTFTAAFLDKPTARKAAFDRLLKVEEYRDGAELLLDTAKLINEKSRAVRERIAFAEGKLADYDHLAAERKQLLEAVAALTQSIAELEDRIALHSTTVAEGDRALLRWEEARAVSVRLKVEGEGESRRLLERQTERDRAAEAVTRRDAAAGAHEIHLSTLVRLRELEQERTARDRLLREAADLEKQCAVAALELKRIDEALAAAVKAGQSAADLVPALAVQTALEIGRESLRDQRAEATSAATALQQLETERSELRKQFASIRERIRLAETGAGAEEELAALLRQRREAEAELSRLRNLETSGKHLAKQRADAQRDADRLRQAIAAREREFADGGQSAARAGLAAALRQQEKELTETLAHLRAIQARDEKMQAEVRNGLCPILSQKCLNLAEGENLDDYFRVQFAHYGEQLGQLEAERTRVSTEVQRSRDAEKQVVRGEAARQQTEVDRALLSERETALAGIETELTTMPADVPAMIGTQRRSIAEIEQKEKAAGQAALLYAELRPLKLQLEEVEGTGKRLSESREALVLAAGRLAEIEQAQAENERQLRELADPRARSQALLSEASREAQLRQDRTRATEELSRIELAIAELNGRLDQSSGLEAALTEIRRRHDETLAAHRVYVASEPLAATWPSREADLAESRVETERIARETAVADAELADSRQAYDADRHAAEKAALAGAREQAAGARALLAAKQTQAATLQSELERLDAIRESLRDELREAAELTELAQATEFIRDTLKQAGPLVARSYLYNISLEANQLFREITGEAGRTLRWSEDYEVLLEEEGHERPFHNLSGGEQMAAALAVRLALLKQLSDIRIAFFDEPTANLDAERRERLAQQIAQVQHFDQLFIISHDDTFQESVDHIVNVHRSAEPAAV